MYTASIATQYKKVKGSEFAISDDVGHLTERVVQQNFLTISWTLNFKLHFSEFAVVSFRLGRYLLRSHSLPYLVQIDCGRLCIIIIYLV